MDYTLVESYPQSLSIVNILPFSEKVKVRIVFVELKPDKFYIIVPIKNKILTDVIIKSFY